MAVAYCGCKDAYMPGIDESLPTCLIIPMKPLTRAIVRPLDQVDISQKLRKQLNFPVHCQQEKWLIFDDNQPRPTGKTIHI